MTIDTSTTTKTKTKQQDINDSFSIFSFQDSSQQQQQQQQQQQRRVFCHPSDMDQSESWVVPKIKYRQSHHSSHFRIIVCGDSGMIDQ
jgi:hypothetical protein